ncbi:major facilitator superfamily domain-containing protein [Xylariaceae sp. FL0594]|nr:major facilitator superfamily domain-containing protein [Xylariaceae sp. FL0594]
MVSAQHDTTTTPTMESEKDLRSPSFTTTDDPPPSQQEEPMQQPRDGGEKEKNNAPPAQQQQQQQQRRTEEEFKEGGYGWVVVAATFFLNAHTWGLNSSYAVFLAYYLRTDAFHTSAIAYAFVGGLSVSIALLISPLATFMAGHKRIGTRGTIFAGVILEFIGFLGSSFAAKLWHLILSQGVSFGLGMGLIFVASAPVSAQWFRRKRSLANGWTASGSGFGGMAYSLATNALIERIGLAWTFRALALICLVVNGVAGLFIRDRNHAVGSVHVAFNLSLFRRPSFVLFQTWLVLSILGYTILVFSIVAYCQAIGLSAAQASLVGALFNLGQGLGRPAVGLSSDVAGRLNVANLCTLWCSILCYFVWIFGARTYAGCIVFALLSGTVAGVMWAAVSPICAEVVGLAMIPSALSITWLVLVLPATFAEVIGLSLRKDSLGTWSYRDVQLFSASMYLAAFVFGWMLRAWKVWELERAHLSAEERERAITDDAVVVRTSSHLADGGGQLHRLPSRASTVKEKVLHLRGLWAVVKV